MPNNLQEPSHALMEVVAQHDAYRNYLSGGKARRSELLSPEAYYNLLARWGRGSRSGKPATGMCYLVSTPLLAGFPAPASNRILIPCRTDSARTTSRATATH
ncbi:unnamed protein product [Ectocarpus fasciculatus]